MNKICPNCEESLTIHSTAKQYMDQYVQPCTVRTSCCGELVRTIPFVDYDVEEYDGTDKEDDWGR